MKVLLAPAETKNIGGDLNSYRKENFFLEELFENRNYIFNEYEKYIKESNIEELSKWFGLKKIDDVVKYKESLLTKPSMKAIQRYNGVAFDAIEYNALSKNEQKYIDNNVVIFSNLFGPIKADDLIPDYKYKQGAKLPDISVEKYYLDNFSLSLDDYLGNEIIDLRAGHYEKFYKIKNAKTLTFKFLKEGKVVSHWAKHYRGALLNFLAKNNIKTIEEFMNSTIQGLKLKEIQEKKNIKLLVMEII